MMMDLARADGGVRVRVGDAGPGPVRRPFGFRRRRGAPRDVPLRLPAGAALRRQPV